MADKMTAVKHYNWLYLSHVIIERLSFFTELCVMTPDISCRSLTQIGLEISRWRITQRPCKAMVVSQAFICHFKCYSILHFAVCQLQCWAFLFVIFVPKRASSNFCYMLIVNCYNHWKAYFNMNSTMYYSIYVIFDM